MRRFFTNLLFIIILGGAYYVFQEPINSRLLPLVDQASVRLGITSAPCTEPIPYVLGTFDTKFGISKSYFLDALAEAEAIWEEPYGRELFAYQASDEDENSLKINLVYDYRQDATNKLAEIDTTVGDNKASYEKFQNELEQMKERFAKMESDLAKKIEVFNTNKKMYEDKVKYWNARGGAPEKEYSRLQAEEATLNDEVSELQSAQNKVNTLANDINALVVVLNRLASTLNLAVAEYNTTAVVRGESFEEGVYIKEGTDEYIDIYEFSSRDKLVRVLTHELGHALGLEHVEDSKAIMYELNQGDSKKLSSTDLEALSAICGVE